MSLISISLSVKNKSDGKVVKVPIITPLDLDSAVSEIAEQKQWNIVSVSDNSGTFSYGVVNGKIDYESA